MASIISDSARDQCHTDNEHFFGNGCDCGARLHGRLHDRQRLRCAPRRWAGRSLLVADSRILSEATPQCRFRRSTGPHCVRRVQGALPGRGSPAQRRYGFLKADATPRRRRRSATGTTPRTATSTFVPSAHRLRQHQAGSDADSRGRHALADECCSRRAPVALSCSPPRDKRLGRAYVATIQSR